MKGTAALGREVEGRFAALFPSGWAVTPLDTTGTEFDRLISVRAPDRSVVRFAFAVKRAVAPREVAIVSARLLDAVSKLRVPTVPVVGAPFLSELTREALVTAGVGYVDTTGNVFVRCDRPGLFLQSTGALRDPSPSDDKLRSLGGRGAIRAVRAVVDFRTPYGIRELAERADVPLGTLARVVELLYRDGLVERTPRGPIERVDVSGVIRRWAKDYSISKSNRVVSVLSARGIPALLEQISKIESGYAATGALAASRFAPVGPTRLAALYVSDAEKFARRVDLRPVDTGANVWLIEPANDVVFDRVTLRNGLLCVSPSQLAVDLLTGPGRDPSEGEELLSWMEKNRSDWQS